MPIYDQGYRRYVARSPLHRLRFWPITREALRIFVQRRFFVMLSFASLVPAIVGAIWIYMATRFPEAGRLLPIDGQLFGAVPEVPAAVRHPALVSGASGSIANDLRTGAMLVYLSRPLTSATTCSASSACRSR